MLQVRGPQRPCGSRLEGVSGWTSSGTFTFAFKGLRRGDPATPLGETSKCHQGQSGASQPWWHCGPCPTFLFLFTRLHQTPLSFIKETSRHPGPEVWEDCGVSLEEAGTETKWGHWVPPPSQAEETQGELRVTQRGHRQSLCDEEQIAY